ncbi:27088_t:CDS:2 [Gigaspora margarita]|uniref:27088_t:CDS:1 n=1 Tax=Gigaspora margarita TaxID=4874 RepID=A0ABN7UVQ0_GIGMA|nr:27088_t:CDS:2 [Gigaspora margarita]
MEAKIKDMSTWMDSDHNAVIAKIYLGHLIEKKKGNQDLNNLEGVEMNNSTGKKELDHLWNIIHNAIIKVKTELEKSILVLGKIIRGIRDSKVSQLNSNTVVFANNNILYINKKLDLEIGLLQPQNLNEGEQDLRG